MDNNLSDDATSEKNCDVNYIHYKNADRFYSQMFLEETLVA